MDKFDALIEDIRVELDSLTGGSWPKSRWVVGKLKKDEHATYPRIEWEEAGGNIVLGQLQGTNTGNIAGDAESFTVTIWNASREACRTTLHNLIVATRNKAFGPNFRFGTYEWADEAHTNRGRKLAVRLTLTIGVTTEVVPEAAAATQGHEVLVGGEVIC